MLRLYTWNTPNGQKPVILLEELQWEYDLIPVNISREEQHKPEFREVNPNGKIPALIDDSSGQEVRIFESGAVLLHLAERAGRFVPSQGAERAEVLSWTFWQVGGPGPMIGQWGHFANRDPAEPYATERYLKESQRLYEVLEGNLKDRDFVAGDYSIADMMLYPWIGGALALFRKAGHQFDIPRVEAWVERIAARPAVVHGMERLKAAVAAAKE